MPTLDQAELEQLESALKARHRFLSEQVALASDGKQVEIDRYHGAGLHDQGEESAEEQVIDNATAIIGHLRAELADVGAALRRLEGGEYGQCRDCDAAIPLERLKAQPHASRCVTCQSAADPRH